MSSLWTPDGERPVPRQGSGPAPRPPAAPQHGPTDADDMTNAASQPTVGHSGTTGHTGAAGGSGATPGTRGADGSGQARSAPAGMDEATAAEVDRLRREVAATPAAVVVANHAYGLFELAAIHLSEQPPRLEDARLAVDAFGSLVETLGERLGEAAPQLRDALAQIRLAFVQISGTTQAANGGGQPST